MTATSATRQLLNISDLSAGFGTQQVLTSLNLHVNEGETLVILGESGCGKTTLLRALAGLIPISSGKIILDSTPIQNLPPKARSVIYLDQEPLLFEHLDVTGNIGFALKLKRTPSREIQETVSEMLHSIDLSSHAHKREWQLSGGQKQRVTFARAVVAKPQLLLLDEPFCSLDSKTRQQMQVLYAALRHRYGLTSIFVTHDVKESLIVGDRFARMSRGKLYLYSSRREFINDSATGISDEIMFWKQSAEMLEEQ